MFKITAVASILCMTLFIASEVATANFKDKEKSELKKNEPALDNSDVRWNGGFLGLLPRISKPADKWIKKISPEDEKWLLKNLLHEDRFAICHVALVLHWGPPSKDIEHSLVIWYGLSTKDESSPKPQYKKSDRKKLYDVWTKALANRKSRYKYGQTGISAPPFKKKVNKKH
ncbi:MAG: hypothetical protein K0U86_03385 [Planctomycetes bacterium]|nr:hypothetical protein [Planctomycetota bacterium]MCH9723930.1 hypothetical protein [Planctomycetota bacterium]MCH9778656.1 hypothetical protein [Planctomycetota bacterium]MCH9791542.1 hypothetical protein [Planctomycetota bacterium]MDF1744114.1 hypothetical protein [Gimesia sp.]